MMCAIIGGRSICMQGSLYAAALYASEFERSFDTDMSEAVGTAEFPAFLLRSAWAMARGASDDVASFSQWMLSLNADESSDAESAWEEIVEQCIIKEMLCGELPPMPSSVDDSSASEEDKTSKDDFWTAWQSIAAAKTNGFSLDEIRRMTVHDLLTINILMHPAEIEQPDINDVTAADSKAAFWG